MASERLLIRGGTVLTLDPDLGELSPGEVLVEDGKIAAVGQNLDAGDAEVIEVDEHSIVLPGFVDTHRHTWQAPVRNVAADWTLGHYLTGIHAGLSKFFRPDDTYIGNLLGTLEALNSGITTLLDWSHNLATPEHADAAVKGLMDSGSRAVFAHGGGAPQWAPLPNEVPHPDDAKRIKEQYFSSDDQLVTMAMALRGPQFATKETTLLDYKLAREIGSRITVHVGDGEFGKSRPVEWMNAEGLMAEDVTYVHCNMLGDDELKMIGDSGGAASVSADIEMSMGHGWPATGRLIKAGVPVSLSIDVCSLNGGDMFGAMKSTVECQRALDNAAADADGTVIENLAPTARELPPGPGGAPRAVADEAGTTVMSFGAPRGEAFSASGWEARFRATAIRERDPEQARALYEEGLATDPDGQWANYDLACWHALYGSADQARALLDRAIELGGDEVRAQAREDPDLASLRDDEAPA